MPKCQLHLVNILGEPRKPGGSVSLACKSPEICCSHLAGMVSIRLACHPILDNKIRAEVCSGVSGKDFLAAKKELQERTGPSLLPLDIVGPGCDNENSWSHPAASLWMKPIHKGGQGPLRTWAGSCPTSVFLVTFLTAQVVLGWDFLSRAASLIQNVGNNNHQQQEQHMRKSDEVLHFSTTNFPRGSASKLFNPNIHKGDNPVLITH